MKANSNQVRWAKAWVLVTNLLLLSAVLGVKFNGVHVVVAVACMVYGVAVWCALGKVPRSKP